MSNSSLVDYKQISPNRTSPRNHKIDTITIHCYVGQVTAESMCSWLCNPSAQASANYGIDRDGRVALIVEEKDRSCCSSNAANDHRAITIECASDTTDPYKINDKVYNKLVDLLEDICRRNGIEELRWKADPSLIGQPEKQNMTVHRWFAAKACPGDYIYNRLGQIAAEVNKRLRSEDSETDTSKYTKIEGKAKATVKQMRTYIKKKNPKVAQSVLDMIPLYLTEGGAEGIRGDVAFAQSCLETGNFTFKDSAVTLSQNNFCGMGVTANGMRGNSFESPQIGIRAQIQHLKAYANTKELQNGCVDPRFKYVERGCAKYVEWLGIQENPKGKGWAAGADYGSKILRILNEIIGTKDGINVEPDTGESWYRVRKEWGSKKSQLGAFHDLEKAKNLADDNPGYSVFDENGNCIYAGKPKKEETFQVRVTIDDLLIRTGPGTNYTKTGDVTGVGTFHITEVRNGIGSSSGWGKLQSGAGWISLDYAIRI